MADIQYLDDLLDVQVPAPNDGDVLYWDAAASLWKHKPIPVGEGGILERLIRASSDDIRAYWTGAAWSSSIADNYWISGYNSGTMLKMGGGGRFLNIYIPNGATIVHAYFKPTARTSDNKPDVNSRFHGEKNATPLTFSDYANYAARTRTDAMIPWDAITPWTLGTQYQSPDLKAIFQEIVNLPTWASGNSLVLFWDDHDDRTAHVAATLRRTRSWDHTERTPPMLYIEWTA